MPRNKFCDLDPPPGNGKEELRTAEERVWVGGGGSDLSACIIQEVAAVDPVQNPPLCSISRHAGLQFVRRSQLL